MLDLKSVLNEAIPEVDPLDVKRLWSLQSQYPENAGVSYSTKAISQICGSDSADPIAVWARTGLVSILLQEGSLDKRRENGELDEAVFQAAARFPLPNGLQGMDFDEFIATLPV